MKLNDFHSMILALDEKSWLAVVSGQAIALNKNDKLEIVEANADHIIVSPPEKKISPELFKEKVIANEEELLNDYFQSHPVSTKSFQEQFLELTKRYGVMAFAATEGQLADYSLFVDKSELVAEGRESPRHQYGVYCEIDNNMSESEAESRVMQWVTSGEAYERYLEMNVCRYSCI